MDENKVEVKKEEKFPLPFDTDGWLWDNVPLFFWILTQFLYLAVFIPCAVAGVVLLGVVFVVAIVCVILWMILKHIVWPLTQTFVISLVYPDGKAFDEIKKVWKSKPNDKDN
jgi:hypothetical protein